MNCDHSTWTYLLHLSLIIESGFYIWIWETQKPADSVQSGDYGVYSTSNESGQRDKAQTTGYVLQNAYASSQRNSARASARRDQERGRYSGACSGRSRESHCHRFQEDRLEAEGSGGQDGELNVHLTEFLYIVFHCIIFTSMSLWRKGSPFEM